MKVEMHTNGNRELWLVPEDDLESLLLTLMASAAEKGQPVKLAKEAKGFVLSVPK
jgi:hypothetical protein